MATIQNVTMEKIEVVVGWKGYAKIIYSDGVVIRLNPDKWQTLQSARAKCRAEYGENVCSDWYYQTLTKLRALSIAS